MRNSERNRERLRYSFLALAVISLILNLAGDAVAIYQKRKADALGHTVVGLSRELMRNFDVETLGRFEREVEQDLAQSNRIETSLIWGFAIDSLLLFILGVIFLLDQRVKRKVETSLRESLNLLRSAYSGLQERLMKKDELLVMTAHDLRNPIGVISGYAEIIGDAPDSKESVALFSEQILKMSQQSLRLVESLSRSKEPLATSFEVLDLSLLVEEVCSQLEILASKKAQRIQLHLSGREVLVRGNRLRLEELAANLIGNAIKYSPLESIVTVSVKASGATCQLEVQDQGPGFTETDLLRVFGYGSKLSAKPTAGELSTGYGLFIAKQIVDEHNGQIEVANLPAGSVGACVFVRLPLVALFGSKTADL